MEASLETNTFQEKKQYGGFWIRFAASLIDSIVVGIPMAILIIIIGFMLFNSTGAIDAMMTDSAYMEQELTDEEAIALLGTYLVSVVVSLIVSTLYFAGLHASKWQATVGKKLLGLKVTDLNGNRISFWRSLGRYLAMMFLSSILLIGYIIAAFTEKKQSLHDLIAGTVVLKK
ncbi:hypothetical protein CVD25_20410 [Bacillus canaveralius]|uniref:RDD domain-containing protein n=1 Tax=Bacillus canaveralius TaxID=1403243 RepID=A0A2N5GJM7_9BACI|nr:RDD family protein [Bacillus canaveralius]PLR81410.1 hypothetical protein CU635_15115 [Bacillus canaveralius]PLR90051.1 hypothetical protein CVD25_20410 [Bacillus canaveralius]RSK53072.1 RDD family protein [Bacillus canaveralius]